MFKLLDNLLEGKPQWGIAALTVALIAVLGTVDWFTGTELSFSVFYLVPISIAAWYGNRAMGYVASCGSAGTWIIVERLSEVPYSQQWILFWNSGVRFMFFIIVAYLLTELRATLARHRKLARTDNLTGLLNRTGFIEHADRIIAAAARFRHTTALAYIDLDGFKAVNDTLGHAQGDDVLRSVGALLGQSSRESDLVARLGGDEFAVLLPHTSLAGARAFFQKLHRRLNRDMRRINCPDVGFSIGAIVFDHGPPPLEDALRLADSLMYRAKKSASIVIEPAGSAEAMPLQKTAADR